jgi:adenylyltransferase/sulfurtransferase
MVEEITATELKALMDAGEKIQLIDVRQPEEFAFAKIEGAKLIPLGELPSRVNELDPTREVVFQCKTGIRSARAVEFLQQTGYAGKTKNLRGGITAWSNEVDPKVPKY